MSRMMWQGFGRSGRIHLVDVEAPDTKKSGRRALCGQYPGKMYAAWFSLDVDELTDRVQRAYGVNQCPGCVARSEKSDPRCPGCGYEDCGGQCAVSM